MAEIYTILAAAPGGPSWFVVEKDAEGFSKNKPEDKHGIRASNTAALFLEDVYVDADRLMGGVEGQGLAQAQAVFGYTRLMVAAFGLGAGWAALKRAIPYSQTRVQGGATLNEKQGYTHKLIVPNAVRLEAARAYIEWTAERIDGGDPNQQTEGAVAKYLATEAGNKACEDSIQALGGYGYTKEYMVEKFKRDVRITTIYEGTSEIMEWTIGRDRWQLHLKTKGAYYNDWAAQLEALARTNNSSGAATAALAMRALAVLLERARIDRLTRNQHILFRLGELIAFAETAAVFAERAVNQPIGRHALQPGDAAGHEPHPCPRRCAQGRDRRAALGHRRRTERPQPGRLAQPARHLRGAGRPARRHGFRRQASWWKRSRRSSVRVTVETGDSEIGD